MLEKNSCQHNFSAAELKKINKRINLQFELKSKQQLQRLLLKSIDLLLNTVQGQAEAEKLWQQIFRGANTYSDLQEGEIKYIVYELVEIAEKNNFWTYNFSIKLINRLHYIQSQTSNDNLRQQLLSYFSDKLATIENNIYALQQPCATELETIAKLIFNLWQQYNKQELQREELLLIKLQLQELNLDPQQKIKVKDFYKFLNNNPELCLEFISGISEKKYNEYAAKELPLISGLLELEKLLNNDNYLCKAIVDKMKGLGIDCDQEQFNLEILDNCLSEEFNFMLDQELELFNFIVELVTDLKAVSVISEKQEAGQALLQAIKDEHVARAKELINSQAEVNVKDKEGKTPLIWAAEKGYEELMMELMKAGAKLDATDNQGRTVLSRIHSYYQMEVMQRLNQNSN